MPQHAKTQHIRLTTKARPAPKPNHTPMPAKNLGAHLKPPRSGEIMTEHRWKGR